MQFLLNTEKSNSKAYYDSDISIWLSVDPLADKYPSLSPYAYCANNPVILVDPDGRYGIPADKLEEYRRDYPMFMKYLEHNVQNDVINSPNIMAGLLKFSGGNLTVDKVKFATEWGFGPNLIIVDNPGFDGDGWMLMGANGYYNYSTNTIQISTRLVNQFENSASENMQAGLFGIYVTLLHETVHYGDYLDGLRQTSRDKSGFGSEPGLFFQWEVFYSRKVKYGNDVYNGAQTQYDHSQIDGAHELIKLNVLEGKSDVIPTLPE